MTTHISPPVSPSHPSPLILLVPPGRFSSQEWPTPGNFSSAPLYFTQRKQNTEPHLGWCADVQQMEKPLFFFSPYHTAFERIWPGNNWNQVMWSVAKDTRWIFLQSVNLLIMNLGEKKKFQIHDSTAPAREPLCFSADSTVLCNSHISTDTLMWILIKATLGNYG